MYSLKGLSKSWVVAGLLVLFCLLLASWLIGLTAC